MTDLSLLERDIKRIVNSHRSMVQRTAAAEKLFQRVSGLHAAIPDTHARSEFRNAYKDLVARTLSNLSSSKAQLADRFLDHARNLKEAEAATEKDVAREPGPRCCRRSAT